MRKKTDKRTRHEEEISEWHLGTDLRNENGFYKIPKGVEAPVKNPEPAYPSVTTILDLIVDFTYPERWWIASEVVDIARAAIEKRKVGFWHDRAEQLVDVVAGQVLLNTLPDSYGVNAGKHWIAKAGGRELQRRANRGTLIHDAALDWAYNGMRVDWDEIPDYAKSLAEARGFTLAESFYVPAIRNVIAWSDRHLDPEGWILCENPVFNWEYVIAGTVDYVGPLRNTDKLVLSPSAGFDEDPAVANASELRTGIIVKDRTTWQLDFKGSKAPKPAHRLQAAAYRKMDHFLTRQANGFGTFEPLPPIDRVANVYVTADYVHLKEWGSEGDPFTLDESFACFLHVAMIFYHFQREALHAATLVPSMSFKTPKPEEFRRFREGFR